MVGKPKRKSEGDLPNARSKARKNDSDHEGDSSGVTDGYDMKRYGKRKEKKKGRMSEPVRVIVREEEEENEDEDEDEYYEDPGREESKEFLELDNLERKKKKNAERAKAQFMEKFAGIVERDAEGIKKLAEKLEKEDSIQNEEFLQTFQAAYALSAPFKVLRKDAKHEEDCYEFASMHQKGQDIIDRALKLVYQFDNLAEKNAKKDIQGLLHNDWVKEDEQIAKMLELGKTVGLEKFECVMNASKSEILDTNSIEAQKKFFPVVDEGDAVGWGKEAKKQERANRKLLKAFERGY